MKFLLVLFVAVAFFATGEALECYKCSECDEFDESASGVTKTTCTGAEVFCTKYVGELSNGTRSTLRGCSAGYRSFDRAGYIASVSVYYCDSNLCNGVSTTSAALSMLMVLALPFVFRSH